MRTRAGWWYSARRRSWTTMRRSAADLKFLYRLRQTHFRNFKSKSGTRIIKLLVPLCFRSSCQSVLSCITNFGNGALALRLEDEKVEVAVDQSWLNVEGIVWGLEDMNDSLVARDALCLGIAR